ncbi:hypothetical protein BDR22DRAFT_560120 [Usnea florida]
MVMEMSKTPMNVPGRRPPLDVNTDQQAWLLAMQLWHPFEYGRRSIPAVSALFPDFQSRVNLRGQWQGVDDLQNLCTSRRLWSHDNNLDLASITQDGWSVKPGGRSLDRRMQLYRLRVRCADDRGDKGSCRYASAGALTGRFHLAWRLRSFAH